MQLLLDYGANIDHQNTWGNTALISAVLKNQLHTVKVLLERGANVDLENNVVGYSM